jgi:hypothetical protein
LDILGQHGLGGVVLERPVFVEAIDLRERLAVVDSVAGTTSESQLCGDFGVKARDQAGLATVEFLFYMLEETVERVPLRYDAQIEIVVPEYAVVSRLTRLGSDFL